MIVMQCCSCLLHLLNNTSKDSTTHRVGVRLMSHPLPTLLTNVRACNALKLPTLLSFNGFQVVVFQLDLNVSTLQLQLA